MSAMSYRRLTMSDDEGGDVDKVNLADDMGTPMRPMKNMLVLAFSFLSIYTAFQGIQNIQSSINQKEGLGVASLSCIYASLILSSILAPLYIHVIGLKMSFIIAFLSHCLYTASNFYPDWWTLIPSSILLGLAVAPMWIARHLYVNAMATHTSRVNKVDLHSSLSKFNGTFFALFGFAQVSGNFISSVILHQSSTDQSDLNQTKICGADDCPGNANRTTKIIRPDTAVVDILLWVYLACGLLGLGLTVIFLRPLTLEKGDRKNVLRKIGACFTVFRNKKLLLIIPLCLSQAANSSILLTGFTKAFVSCSVGVQMVGYVMMVYGLVASMSAISFGHFAKYTGRRPLMFLTLTVDIITLILLLFWKPVPEQTYLLFIIPCIWAIGDGIWMSQVMGLIVMAFPNNQPAVFANLGTWGSSAFTAVLVTDRLLCLRTKFYIAIFLWATGVIGYTVLEFLLSKQAQRNLSADYHRVKEEPDDDIVEFDTEEHTKGN